MDRKVQLTITKTTFALLVLCALQSPLALAMDPYSYPLYAPRLRLSTPGLQAQHIIPSAEDIELINNSTLLNDTFMNAIAKQDIDRVRHLILLEAHVNTWSNTWDFTPLALAAQHGPEICQLLISANACINHEDKYGWTALWNTQNVDTCKLLIDARASINHPSKNSNTTPLMHAIWANRPSICQVLIEAGANVYMLDDQKETALTKVLSRDSVDLPAKVQIIESILGVTARLNEHEKRSLLNWFLIYDRLLRKKIGFNNDLKKYIARTIQRSLAQDLYANAIRAGAAKALVIAHEKNVPELVMQLETYLNMDELERIVHRQTWPVAPIKLIQDKNK